MKIKNISLIFTLICFLLLFSFYGYCLSGSNENIETYDNPDIDYNSYRYFTFVADELSPDYLLNKIFQSSVIKLLEDKNYICVENIKEADFVIILYSSNRYEKSSIEVPVYNPGKKIKISLGPSGHPNPPAPNPNTPNPHPTPPPYVYLLGDWGIKTVINKKYYPLIEISCIGNLQNRPELIWQGNGIKSTSKSNLAKYGEELIEEILAQFPEISEKIEEVIPPNEIKESSNIEILLEQLKNN